MLLLLPVLVQSYSLGNTLPARTRATRCSSVRLAEGKDYMLQELNPAKAGILCVGHPRHPRHPCHPDHPRHHQEPRGGKVRPDATRAFDGKRAAPPAATPAASTAASS